MESSDNNRELLDNVTMAEPPPFMIQRVESQLLTSELLPSHSGLVVEMGNTDYLPNVTYTTDDLLSSHDLTEEDRNLAAALVAVQLVQQQKQQQLNQDSNVIINSNSSLVTPSSFDSPKDDLSNPHQFVISTVDKPVLASMETSYMNTVGTRHLQQLPPLKKYGEVSLQHDEYDPGGIKQEYVPIKNEIEHFVEDSTHQRDSDGDNKIDTRSSKKSLPHKKRISRKLNKKTNCTVRKPQKCNLCDQLFNSNEELQNHNNTCTNVNIVVQPNVFSCQICSAICKNQLEFFEHLKTHYEPSSQTQQNNHQIKDEHVKNELSNIKDSLLSSLLPPLNCLQCGKNFKRQKAFEAHMRDAHTNKVEDEFSEPEDLMEGIRSVVEANDRDSDDEPSDNKTWYDANQIKNDDLVLGMDLNDHVCHLCGQIFNNNDDVITHMQACKGNVQLNSEQLPQNDKQAANRNRKKRRKSHLSCPHCDRVFSHRNSLMYHMQGHTGERPHQCDVCGKSFFASSALKVHMRLHSGDKPYKCEYCGRHFRQWGDLKYHCISIHSDEKQYQCEYCGKDFARKYSLIVHRRIHTGEKNYRCEFCGKTFRASSYLQNHRRIHTGEKPHPCEVCGKPFRVRSDMKRHLNTHSRRRPCRSTPVLEPTQPVIEQQPAERTEPSAEQNEPRTEPSEHQEPTPSTAEVQYTRDPLEAVREGTNTLFTNGHHLFICYPGDIPVRPALETQWIQDEN